MTLRRLEHRRLSRLARRAGQLGPEGSRAARELAERRHVGVLELRGRRR